MKNILKKFDLKAPYYGASTGQNSWSGTGEKFKITSPVDGNEIGQIQSIESSDFDKIVYQAQEAFHIWRSVPAPQRGEIVRQFGDELRHYKESLGTLVSYEMGKSLQEGLGEVQEMIDICDYAVGTQKDQDTE